MRKPKEKHFPKAAVQLFHSLGQPVRLEILLAIGAGEACVCHLEAALGQRQAYISQQLMALRKAGLVSARREGRNIFYRLANSEILGFIQEAGRIAGIREEELNISFSATPLSNCCCPHCAPEQEAGLLLNEEEIQVIGS
jgi:DNA-binding transcriptional ArsR family regulator